jgi:hypothetical protein
MIAYVVDSKLVLSFWESGQCLTGHRGNVNTAISYLSKGERFLRV